jgi:hypothetical protein
MENVGIFSKPTIAAAPLSVDFEDSKVFDGQKLLRLIRVVRAEAQDLRAALVKVRDGEVAFSALAGYLKKSSEDLELLMEELSEMESVVPPDHCDHVRHLINLWELVAQNVTANQEEDQDSQKYFTTLSLLIGQLDGMVAECGFLTIPSRVNRWLAQANPGHYIPFHEVFMDELPDEAERTRILNFMAWSPGILKSGYVDTESGLIYRFEENRVDRIFSLLTVITALVGTTLIIISTCYLGELGLGPTWPLEVNHKGLIALGWVSLVVGIAVHAGVATVKSGKAGRRPPVIARGDMLLLVSARKGQLMLKMFLAAVGLFGLIFVAGVNDVTALNAFLVGYSLDSFVGLFGESIESRAQLQVAGMREKLNLKT